MTLLHLWHQSRRREQDGASSVEYGLIAVAIAALVVVVVFALGGVVKGMFSSSCTVIGNAASAATASC